MKRLIPLFAALFMISVVLGHSGSHSNLPEAGKTPGDLLYGLEKAQESISLALTFDKEARAEKKMKFARERLSESVHLVENGNKEAAAKTAKRYTEMMKEVNRTARETGNEELQEKVKQSMRNDREVLSALSETLPSQAQKSIQTALSNIGGGPESAPVNSSPENDEENQSDSEDSSGGFIVTGRAVSE